jgi:hypothetical protein
MAGLNRYLEQILPEDQGIGNLGLAYRRLGFNLYKNKYQSRMQELVQTKMRSAIAMSMRAFGELKDNKSLSMIAKPKVASPTEKEQLKPNQDKPLTLSIQRKLNAASFYSDVKRLGRFNQPSEELHYVAT